MLFKKKKVNVQALTIQSIVEKFISTIKCKIMVYIEIKNNGEVILHTNRPGVLIGPEGRDIELLERLIKKYGATKVTVKEIYYVASNYGVGYRT